MPAGPQGIHAESGYWGVQGIAVAGEVLMRCQALLAYKWQQE